MKEFIYPEMMVHVPVCTSKVPENVLIISDKADLFSAEMQKHADIASKVIGCNLDVLRNEADASYDVVICEMSADAAVVGHISRILKEDGQLSVTHDSLEETQSNKILMQVLGNYFKIIMPYNLGTGSTALLASKEYHPTADVILQRTDMIDGLDYYNCDIHVSAFAMPNYVRKEYLGIIKN
ncbi:MAG: spermidine synthase [Campylobacterota bacterium]|nr:spermidine synthase [Campylobacterota bacterium]